MAALGGDMRIGVDFDNTIADYDDVFVDAARQEGLFASGFAGGKAALREALRAEAGGEERWMRLQGQVYGALMSSARLIDGFTDFLDKCRAAGIAVYVISHKTEYGHFDTTRVRLRDAARRWMTEQGLFDRHGLPQDRVYFEGTRAEKIARIEKVGCTHFIDDLEEVFLESSFPSAVKGYLLSRGKGATPKGPFVACRSWHEISDAILH
jgi:hypothetical protein